MHVRLGRALLRFWAFVTLLIAGAGTAQAANCNYATAQGATGPSSWQTYCWIDFATYNDVQARSTGGQSYSLTLQDGSVMSFVMRVSGAAITAVATPTWTGGAVGNTAFLGIPGRPALYQSAAGTTTVTISNIVITPPPGAGAVSNFMFVAADAESSNDGESLSFQSNGGGWVLLDQVGPISGATYPGATGTGSATFTTTGVPGTVGAYIVGSTIPTTVTTTIVGGGLQGAMFAVRFASIRLTTQISGARAAASDQFTFSINAGSSGTVLATGTSTGTGLGPFTAAALSVTSSLPVTLNQAMASGSASTLARYRSTLTCTNSNGASATPLPSGVVTTSYAFPALQFGDAVQCAFTATPFPQLTLRKALGATGRQFASDQFVLSISQGSTVMATTTTTGTGATVGNAATPQFQATAGTPYSLAESGAGVTSLNQYNATMACTNAASGTGTALPTTVGGTITPTMGDVVTCTITNTRIAANARLTIAKDAVPLSDPVNGTTNPKYIPGAIVRYTFTVSNTGPRAVDTNTVWLIDTLPSQLSVGTAASPVFTQGSPTSGLTFNAATDIRYSNAAVAPTSFAGCSYTPVSAYDPAVRFVCLNPKGAMAGSTGTPPSFTLSIQALVR
ncbi:hypothetical protein ACFOON_09955 [Novosphingobium piscinae]|uniref:SpaA-like prealbumin fold domain-containing protein n=1 Tax=Novosphingobium piscinae TaxID=1507448 RepID=A0A7X1G0D5_9SPHN|nr:hypothetical protein [Novosphingobium piscinae]MBC2670179.1 hypothetical protein [Novosphingobium piscinae]